VEENSLEVGGRDRRGKRGSGLGGYRTNLMLEEEEKDSMSSVFFSEEDRVYSKVLQRKQEMTYPPHFHLSVMLLTPQL
jgi:hypothetical protein